MKKVKQHLKSLIKKYKTDNYLRIITELCLLSVSFVMNKYVGLGFFLILIIELLLSKSIDVLIYSLVFLSFYDEILQVSFLHGSLSRVILVLCLLKSLFIIFKQKIKIPRKDIFIVVFFLVAIVANISSIVSSLISFLNIGVIVLLSIIASKTVKNKDKFIERLLLTIVISVLVGVIYGFLAGNFMAIIQDKTILYRFNGTYEPNFMCMYIDLAVLSFVTIKEKINKCFYYLVFGIFINAILLTGSITGLLTLCVCLVVYFIINFKQRVKILESLLIIACLSGIMLFGVRKVNINNYLTWINNKGYSINTASAEDILIGSKKGDYSDLSEENIAVMSRYEKLKYYLVNGKFDELTSGRTALVRSFVKASFNRPLINVLIGNNPIVKKVYNSFFNRECYSHNTFVDFLYNFGIIGFCISLYYIAHTTIKGIFLNSKLGKSKYAKNILIIRIMFLIYALSLSFYTKRMVLVFFIL